MSASSSKSKSRKKDKSGEVLNTILSRLNAIEDKIRAPSPAPHMLPMPALEPPPPLSSALSVTPEVLVHVGDTVGGEARDRRAASEQSRASASRGDSVVEDVTDRIIGALSSFAQVRSNHFYISNFDPDVHEFDVWCSEVDRARQLNNWNDNECLSRVGGCLRGGARTWLNEWVTNDRSWTSFKRDFKSLCPCSIDVANILFDTMSTNSDQYPTYAEYARRSLLRLNIVTELSDNLKVAIIIRGITDPQIKAIATNAKLKVQNIVEFLSVYEKPVLNNRLHRGPVRSSYTAPQCSQRNAFRKREAVSNKLECYNCGVAGHKRHQCPKRTRTEIPYTDVNTKSNNIPRGDKAECTYCKKYGHTADVCFAKQRAEASNSLNKRPNNVNFCQKLETSSKNRDVMAAVMQGIPIDALIDSGSNVSLMSESLVRHLRCDKVPSYRRLRGIGSQEIESMYYITAVVEFPEISLEADFFVVPSDCMNAVVLIGTDVLNRKGVTYVRTRESQRLTRNTAVAAVHHITMAETINSQLQGNDRKKLLSLIDDFSESFITGTATSTVKTGSLHIRLNNATPVHYRPYKLSPDEKSRVKTIIDDLLCKNIIRESESEYASPIILVKKKDGSDRMCVDYRALNAVTVKDRFPLPLIDDCIDRLGTSKWFSSLDMATGFHQIPVSPESIKLTAFVTPEGHYEYMKMPYGLANAPVVYQRIISNTLKPLIESGKVLTYIDDVLILSQTVEEGLDTLRQVMHTLTTSGFSINIKKCVFLSTEIEYLGRVISHGQVRPSGRKIDALVKSPKPGNVKQVRQFLGLAGYFRRYIAGYASKTSCISKLTRKGEPFLWGKEQDEVREYIIHCLTNEPVLTIFNPNIPCELHTDASAIGYGAVLLHVHEGRRKSVIGYYSKTTQGAESRYHSYELETLAVVNALKHFRHYLLGIEFKIVTDCNSLKLTERKKDLVPRVARWWVYMQDFRFTIEYRKGALMSHADFLSRNPVVDVHHIRSPKNWAQIAQSADEETLSLIEKLSNGALDDTRYVVQNNVLYYKYSPTGEDSRLLCYIPKGHRLSLLRVFHDEHDHIGIDKTTDLILRHFWFPSLRQFVKKYITHCLTCLSKKKVPRAPHQPISSWSKPDTPFSTIHLDVLGPLPESNGYKYILILVDSFTKFCLLYAMYRQAAEDFQRIFNNAISLFGAPNLIVCDRGRIFENTTFQNWSKELGCAIHFITPEMHRENGQAERYCRTVLNMLRIETSKGAEWSDALWRVQLILNTTKHATTQASALQLLTGVEGTTPVIRALVRDVAADDSHENREAMRSLRRQRASDLLAANQIRQDNYVNTGRKEPRTFNIGDLAFVIKQAQATGKLDSGMRGPYKVTKVLPYQRYELELLADSRGKRTQAASEYMVPWDGEWTPDTCAAFFTSDNDAEDADVDEDVIQSGTAVLEINT